MSLSAASRLVMLKARFRRKDRLRALLAAALYAAMGLLVFLAVHFPKGEGRPTGLGPVLIGAWNAVFFSVPYPGAWFAAHNVLFWVWPLWLAAYGWLVYTVSRGPVLRFWPMAAVVLAAGLPLFITPNIQTVDPWEYLIRGRMLAVYGLNPYAHTPSVIPGDPLHALTVWHGVRFVYGPLWLAFVALLAALPGVHMLQLALLKVAMLAAHVGSAWALWEIRREAPPATRARDTALLLFSPMMIFESAANAHVDFPMIFLLLLGVLLDRRGLPMYAALSLAAATLVKAYAGLALAGYAFALAHRFRGRDMWASLAGALGPAAAAIALCYAPFYDGSMNIVSFRGGGAERHAVNSLGAALVPWLATATVIRMGVAFSLCVAVGVCAWSWRTERWLEATAVGAFLWCTVGATWLMAWYACFALALALTTDIDALRDAALLLSFLTFSFYIRSSGGWPIPSSMINPHLKYIVPGWPLLALVLSATVLRRRPTVPPL